MYKQDVYMFGMLAYNIISGQKFFSDMLLCEAIELKKKGKKPNLEMFESKIPKSFLKLI